jgi:polygalacturonase
MEIVPTASVRCRAIALLLGSFVVACSDAHQSSGPGPAASSSTFVPTPAVNGSGIPLQSDAAPADAARDAGAEGASPSEPPPPPAPSGAESAQHNPPPCVLSKWGIAVPAITQPSVRVEDFGARGDGVTDDTAAINAAVQSLSNGGTVLFESGKKYLRKGKVTVDKANVQLWGYGATILAYYAGTSGDAHSTFRLTAPGASIYGMTIISDARLRNQNGNDNAAVWTESDDNRVIDNRVEYGAGLMFRLATHYVAARNVVYRTTADAIHTTTDSADGLVVCNTVRENGDDMIAVVNYAAKNTTPAAPSIHDIVIEGNDVSGNYWGRGISVMGGKNVTVRGNTITRTVAAGIIVEQEGSYHTANVENATFENNVIRDVQTQMPAYRAPNVTPQFTGHGGIEIAAAYGSVRGLVVGNNVVDHVAGNGIRVRSGLVCGSITSNTITNAGAVEVLDNATVTANCALILQNNN